MNAQALLVQWPSMSFLIKLQSRSCVAVWATFIFPWCVEGTASSQEVRLLFLWFVGPRERPTCCTKTFSPPLPCPRQARTPLQPALLLPPPLDAPVSLGSWGWRSSAQLSSYPWAPKPAKPGALISLWNLSRLSLSPFTSHTHHTLHTLYHKCIQDIHCIPFTQTFSHLCTHMQKTIHTETSLRNIHIYTRPEPPAYTVTQTGTHSCTPRHTPHCTHSCARSQCTSTRPWVPMHWLLPE